MPTLLGDQLAALDVQDIARVRSRIALKDAAAAERMLDALVRVTFPKCTF